MYKIIAKQETADDSMVGLQSEFQIFKRKG